MPNDADCTGGILALCIRIYFAGAFAVLAYKNILAETSLVAGDCTGRSPYCRSGSVVLYHGQNSNRRFYGDELHVANLCDNWRRIVFERTFGAAPVGRNRDGVVGDTDHFAPWVS